MKAEFEIEVCDNCDSDDIKHLATVTYKRVDYNTYKCNNCGNIMSNEPDWDSLSGGHDDR